MIRLSAWERFEAVRHIDWTSLTKTWSSVYAYFLVLLAPGLINWSPIGRQMADMVCKELQLSTAWVFVLVLSLVHLASLDLMDMAAWRAWRRRAILAERATNQPTELDSKPWIGSATVSQVLACLASSFNLLTFLDLLNTDAVLYAAPSVLPRVTATQVLWSVELVLIVLSLVYFARADGERWKDPRSLSSRTDVQRRLAWVTIPFLILAQLVLASVFAFPEAWARVELFGIDYLSIMSGKSLALLWCFMLMLLMTVHAMQSLDWAFHLLVLKVSPYSKLQGFWDKMPAKLDAFAWVNFRPSYALALILFLVPIIAKVLGSQDIRLISMVSAKPKPDLRRSGLDVLNAMRSAHPDEPLKVVVVAAEGGGIHAAYRAGVLLTELSAAEPTFWDHVLMVSSVSGGSLGSSAAYVNSQIKSTDDPRSRMGRFVGDDFLTPVVGRLLFCEPLGLVAVGLPQTDHGKALESAYLHAVRRMAGKGHESQALRLANKGIGDIDGPLLAFNTTASPDGTKFVLSRFVESSTSSWAGLTRAGINGLQPSIASASCASARFPLFPGAGRIPIGNRGAEVDILDGGLHENSGLETALTAISEARRWALTGEKRSVEVMLIIIGNNLDAEARGNSGRVAKYFGSGIPIREPSPSKSELSSWGAGVSGSLFAKNSINKYRVIKMLTTSRKSEHLNYNVPGRFSLQVVHFPWSGQALSAPLGWYLSPEKAKLISYNLGLDSYYDRNGVKVPLDDTVLRNWRPHTGLGDKGPEEGILPFVASNEAQQVPLGDTFMGNDIESLSSKEHFEAVRVYNKKGLRQVSKFLKSTHKP